MSALTLSEVQAMMASQEASNQQRHVELLERHAATDRKIIRIEDRIRMLELNEASTTPIIAGGKAVSAMIFAALVAGFIGSLFNFT